MNFNDIIKKSFLEEISTNDLTLESILLTLVISSLIGIYIFFVYRILCKKAFYSKSFAISLVAITLIITAIIMTIKSNFVISLGMVGALSIVRFRTPVKDPLDLVFLFWAIAIGIICGANLYNVAIISSLLLTIITTILNLFTDVQPELLLFINLKNIDNENKIETLLKENTKNYKFRSRTKTIDGIDFIIEFKANDVNKLLKILSEEESIQSVNILNQ